MRIANGPTDRREVVIKPRYCEGPIESMVARITDRPENNEDFLVGLSLVSMEFCDFWLLQGALHDSAL